MQKGEEQEISIEDFFALCQEEGGTYQIDAPDGWQDIGSLVKKINKDCYYLILEDGQKLGCSNDHYIWVCDKENYPWSYFWKKAEDIDVNSDVVGTRLGYLAVVAKEFIGKEDTFDLEVKSLSHKYYSNNIVSHNTGKSMTADALASLYEMPLLRLDIGSLFSAHVGESEEKARKAVSMAESIAPCILWLDEIEKGLGGVQSSNHTDGGVTNRVFGTLLTWMQEKEAPVFVVATANNISAIPPEFQRAGRFDEMFFLDLPDETQRQEVFKCLLEKISRKPKDFNLKQLAKESENYSPAELEKGINNGLFVAYSEGRRPLTNEDIITEMKKFQPLYNTRKEEIEAMREWAASGRARLANTVSNKSYETKDLGRQIDTTGFDIDEENI